jgi:hypothetical protein
LPNPSPTKKRKASSPLKDKTDLNSKVEALNKKISAIKTILAGKLPFFIILFEDDNDPDFSKHQITSLKK